MAVFDDSTSGSTARKVGARQGVPEPAARSGSGSAMEQAAHDSVPHDAWHHAPASSYDDVDHGAHLPSPWTLLGIAMAIVGIVAYCAALQP